MLKILDKVKHDVSSIFVFSYFLMLTGWWAVLYFFFESRLIEQNLVWAATYQFLAWFGAIYALKNSHVWGDVHSRLGMSMICFGAGLLLQGIGQTVFSFYTTILHIDIPYPSLADIGFFGSIPFYLSGAYMLAQLSGAEISIKSFAGRIQVLFVPIFMLSFSFIVFLGDYQYDWSQPLKTFLDIGYPLGQAMYVSIAILALSLSWKTSGGMIRQPIIFLIIALVVQYFADFIFLYQAHVETFYSGGTSDFLYLVSYFCMTMALIRIGSMSKTVAERVCESPLVENTAPTPDTIVTRIIFAQQEVIGDLAWVMAQKIEGISVDEHHEKAHIAAGINVRNTIETLVTEYKTMFGNAAVAVSKKAIADMLHDISAEIPESLQ